MSKQYLLILLITSVVYSSCTVVNNLYPISENENDFLFKKEFIGKWEDAKDSSTYQVDTVEGTKGKLYRAIIAGRDEEDKNIMDTAIFLVRLVQLNKTYFIDCQFDLESNFPFRKGDYRSWMIARHFVYALSFLSHDKIEVAPPDPDELIRLINDKKLLLNYYTVREDDYLVLDKPEVLQAALKESLKYVSTVYEKRDVLIRLK